MPYHSLPILTLSESTTPKIVLPYIRTSNKFKVEPVYIHFLRMFAPVHPVTPTVNF